MPTYPATRRLVLGEVESVIEIQQTSKSRTSETDVSGTNHAMCKKDKDEGRSHRLPGFD